MSVRGRWLVLVFSRVVTAAAAILGVVLAGRAPDWPTKLLGLAIVVMALVVMAIVPRHLAQRWRTPR